MGNGKIGNGAQKLDKEPQGPEVWTERMSKDKVRRQRLAFRVIK